MRDVTLASGRVLTEAEVCEYFRRLQTRQLRHNEAIKEAARAMLRLQKRHARGPGRPPTKQHDAEDPEHCLCADCRRKRFPSYRHEPYTAVARQKRKGTTKKKEKLAA